MIDFVTVARVGDIPSGKGKQVTVHERWVGLFNLNGEYHALDNICLHRGGPLGQGQIHEGRVVCPFHLWEFDCRTGEYEYDPAKRVASYEVKLEGDEILLQVSESA